MALENFKDEFAVVFLGTILKMRKDTMIIPLKGFKDLRIPCPKWLKYKINSNHFYSMSILKDTKETTHWKSVYNKVVT